MAGRVRLSKRLIATLEPGPRDRFVWDTEVVGFGVKITPAAARSFVLQYRFQGLSRRYVIGKMGSPWTVEAARDQARVLLGQLVAGTDPQDDKAAERREPTVAELCALYVEEGLVTRKPTSIASARASLANHIRPLIGSRRASRLTRGEVERFLAQVAEGASARRYHSGKLRGGTVRVKGGKGAATSAIATLSGAFTFGVRRGLCPANPALGVRRFPARKVERFLSPAELARLGETLAAAEAMGAQNLYRIAAIRLLILTGCRKTEILTLKRAHVDRTHRCLRLPDSKTGQKVVHVGSAALAVIEALPEVAGNPYLLPGRGDQGHVADLQSTWEAVRKAAGLADVRIHDLRHSFASFGAAAGDSLLVLGALLGHKTAKTTERYAHLSDHPVRDAAERICARIADLMGAPPAEAAAPPVSEPEAPERAPELAALIGHVVKTRWLDCPAAAARSGLTIGTLATYRSMGVGPPYRKVGRRVVYDPAELDAWIAGAREGWSPAELARAAAAAAGARAAA
jgi:integrase